jgi:hypothetical protein
MAKASDTRPRLPKRAHDFVAQVVGLRRVLQARFGKACGKRDFERHGGKIARHDRAQDVGRDAFALCHVEHKLRARPAILRDGADDAGGA